ncbi:MAG: (Fe-S)-binding protein [Desulfosudaceae bacterium]
MDLFHSFDWEACRECGECLQGCPVMGLSADQAVTEIRRLKQGAPSRVLKRCTSCFACNFICPRQCNPAQLILARWQEIYHERGLPARAAYFDTNHLPNFRTHVVDRLPPEEKALVGSWQNMSPCEEIFYPGCNVITVPYLTRTRLLDGMAIRGSLDVCCGETYYRMGLFDELVQQGRRLQKYFAALGVRRMIIPCTAGRNMFTNVLPAFGIRFDFTVTHLLELLWEKVAAGELRFPHPVNRTVTIQDSCYAKMFGPEYTALPRKLLEAAGATVIEEELHGQSALCCGIAGGFSPYSGYHPLDITLAAAKALNQARKTGARAVVTYCAGCLQMLSVGKIAYPVPRLPVYHLLEILQMAMGETPDRRNRQRSWTMFGGVVKNQFPRLLSPRRHRVRVTDAAER